MIKNLPGTWLISDNHAANEDDVDLYFYLDCEQIVPPELVKDGKRIGFHTGPYRGGSPIQNAILRGHDEAPVYCYVMDASLDMGNVLLTAKISLKGGGEEIFQNLSVACYHLLCQLAESDVKPTGEPIPGTVLPRRTPDQSEITPQIESIVNLYDFIRMLDVTGYPNAFFKVGPFKFRFVRPSLRTGAIHSDVVITVEGE